jgi:predicted ABC-class ATPase
MRNADDLRKALGRIDGKGYKSYRDILGGYSLGGFELHIDHVQSDPFAPPSRMRIIVAASRAGFDPSTFMEKTRRTALEDYLTRAFAAAIALIAVGRRGTGKSGLVTIDEPGQEILERSSCRVSGGDVEIRFRVGLPAAGRRVLSREAERILLAEVPKIVERSLLSTSHDLSDLTNHLDVNEDQDFLRNLLRDMGLVSFVADGAVLPRRSGVDDRMLLPGRGIRVIPFESPPGLRVEVNLPNAGEVEGMGIPEGITLVVGGGFHGKSTLLRAIERGVYNHIPGDGREMVVTREDAVKIRAEDGRSIAGVDISAFIKELPFGGRTEEFSTSNASGSTSQAANIVEALEIGSRLLLIDEDTSATNFMIRDRRMQELVAGDREPITPFIDRIEPLRRSLGISTILVMGGSGDYLDAAERVIMMDCYRPVDVTGNAASIVSRISTGRKREGGEVAGDFGARVPSRSGFDPSRGRRDVKIDAKGVSAILFGRQSIDLGALEQLVDPSQTRAIGEMINYLAERYIDDRRSLTDGIEKVMEDVDNKGMDAVAGRKTWNLARPRKFELAFAINRMRSLRILSPKGKGQ